MALRTGIGDALTEALFARTPQIRCVSHAGGHEVELRERPGRPEHARPHRGWLDHGDGLDAREPLERRSVAVAAQRCRDV
jgi:hypothetical protein